MIIKWITYFEGRAIYEIIREVDFSLFLFIIQIFLLLLLLHLGLRISLLKLF